ncbi:MAG TPA: ABC transporter permease subunit, partial [Chloroflexota bacterium]|nr:ABC transporter permease subunit [Chloroflexota bacterium]
MWLKNVYLKTLRDHRAGALAWGIFPGLLMTITLTQFEQIVGSPEQRGALLALAEQFAWYEAPVGIAQPGGFVTFRLNPLLAILPSVWMLLAASGQLRGDEERGALDLVLAAPLTRTRVVLEKLAALATALVVFALLLGTIVAFAGSAARAEFSALDAYLFALNLALTAGVYGAIALLVSQFVSERSTAAGVTGGILALSFLLHSTARVAPGWEWLAYVSPLYYSGLTKPLVPEVGVTPAAMLVLALLIGLCAALSAWLFTRRDLGFALRLLPVGAPTGRTGD